MVAGGPIAAYETQFLLLPGQRTFLRLGELLAASSAPVAAGAACVAVVVVGVRRVGLQLVMRLDQARYDRHALHHHVSRRQLAGQRRKIATLMKRRLRRCNAVLACKQNVRVVRPVFTSVFAS